MYKQLPWLPLIQLGVDLPVVRGIEEGTAGVLLSSCVDNPKKQVILQDVM